MSKFEWVLFGGTFDPPHLGHKQCVESVLNTFDVGTVLVVPSFNPPVAGEGVKVPAASFQQRLEMAQLLFSSSKMEGQVEVSDLEKNLPQPSFTVNTIAKLKAGRPGTAALLIGDDQLAVFHKWHKAKEIVQDLSLLVVTRDGSPEKSLVNLAKSLELDYKLEKNTATWQGLNTRVEFLPVVSDAASRVMRNNQGSDHWMDAAVANYIKTNGLYK